MASNYLGANIDSATMRALQLRAKANERSVSGELRHIVRDALQRNAPDVAAGRIEATSATGAAGTRDDASPS